MTNFKNFSRMDVNIIVNNITLKKKPIKTVYVHSIYRISRPSYIYLNKHHKTVLALIY